MPIRIAAFGDFVIFRPCALEGLEPRSQCPNPGYLAELLSHVLQHQDWPYEIVPYDRYPGKLVNGSWTGGLFGALQSGQVDLIASLLLQTPFLSQYFAFSPSIIDSKLVIETGKAKADITGSAFLVFKTFGPYFWGLITLLGLLSLGVVCVARLVGGHNLAQIFKRGFRYRPIDKCALKIFLAVMGIGAVLCINLYQTLLFAHLLHPPHKPLFSDPWNLLRAIESNELSVAMFGDHDILYYADSSILESKTDFGLRLQKAVKKYGVDFAQDFLELDAFINSDGYTYFSYTNFIHEMWFEYNCAGIEVVSNADLPVFSTGFVMRKDWALREQFSEALVRMQDSTQNVLEKYAKLYEIEMKTQKCLANTSLTDDNAKSLGLASYFGHMCILGAGCFVSSVCLIVEKCFWKPAISKQRTGTRVQIQIQDMVVFNGRLALCDCCYSNVFRPIVGVQRHFMGVTERVEVKMLLLKD